MDKELAYALAFDEDHPEVDGWGLVDEEEVYHKHDIRRVSLYFENVKHGDCYCIALNRSDSWGTEFETFYPVRKEQVVKTVWKAL